MTRKQMEDRFLASKVWQDCFRYTGKTYGWCMCDVCWRNFLLQVERDGSIYFTSLDIVRTSVED